MFSLSQMKQAMFRLKQIKFRKLPAKERYSPVISQDFVYKFPLPQNCLEGREVSTDERKKEVACIVSRPLVSCVWGCGKSVNSQKLNIKEVQMATHFSGIVLLLSNHTPDDNYGGCMHLYLPCIVLHLMNQIFTEFGQTFLGNISQRNVLHIQTHKEI